MRVDSALTPNSLSSFSPFLCCALGAEIEIVVHLTVLLAHDLVNILPFHKPTKTFHR